MEPGKESGLNPNEIARQLAIQEYGYWPNGDYWCPDCGQWICAGDGKLTDDNFEVHKWCH